MATLREIVFDALQPSALARFWAAVLDGYAVRAYDAAEVERLAAMGLTPETDPSVAVDGPGPTLFFQHTREPKTARNRVHLDVRVADRPREVGRLDRPGARALHGDAGSRGQRILRGGAPPPMNGKDATVSQTRSLIRDVRPRASSGTR